MNSTWYQRLTLVQKQEVAYTVGVYHGMEMDAATLAFISDMKVLKALWWQRCFEHMNIILGPCECGVSNRQCCAWDCLRARVGLEIPEDRMVKWIAKRIAKRKRANVRKRKWKLQRLKFITDENYGYQKKF